MHKRLLVFAILLLLAGFALADGTMTVIKVNGAYGIINKGMNQGIQKGLILYVKRETSTGILDVGKVKVIRTTANRAAVEQMTESRYPILRKGDRLYLEREADLPHINPQPAQRQTEKKPDKTAPSPMEEQSQKVKEEKERPAFEPVSETPPPAREPQPSAEEIKHRVVHKPLSPLKKPWITLNSGAVVPYNNFASSYNTGLMLGASYMVSAGNDFHVGLEVNKTFFSEPSFSGDADLGFTPNSGSLLEALFVVQRFFGRYFFFEAGAGMYRPKIRITSVDNIETTYSETNFGFFGGTGFFIPTSPFAGVSLKGRLHNYYDDSNRQYYGLTGGFRFKIR